MFPPVNTKDPVAVTSFVEGRFAAMYPGGPPVFLGRLFREVVQLFRGEHPNYAPIDLRYHDLEHTLQATVCLVLLLEGRHTAGVAPTVSARQFELAVAGALLHDSGYLKLRSDRQGTGAKYTFCHVLRSCAFAAGYLPALGANDFETEAVIGAINCTGPSREISRLRFREPVERVIGCALATADYLAQMAAPDYPDELEFLFEEFQESDDFIHLPANRRSFHSAQDLIDNTPEFWRVIVMPKLESDFQAVYRFLARPYPHGVNPYLEAVERNIAVIRKKSTSASRRELELAPGGLRAQR